VVERSGDLGDGLRFLRWKKGDSEGGRAKALGRIVYPTFARSPSNPRCVEANSRNFEVIVRKDGVADRCGVKVLVNSLTGRRRRGVSRP